MIWMTDTWSSKNKEGFLAVCAQWLDENMVDILFFFFDIF